MFVLTAGLLFPLDSLLWVAGFTLLLWVLKDDPSSFSTYCYFFLGS